MKAFKIISTLIFSVILFSCKDSEDVKPTIEHYLISQGTTASGLKVKLWSEKQDLTVSYNKLYVSVQKSDSSFIGEPSVTMLPVMDMMTMVHSSPVEQPVFNSTTKLYEGGAVFSMPSGDMGSWQLTLNIGEEEVVLNVNIKSASTGTKYTTTFVGTDGVSYTLSLIEPSVPKIGLNDLVVLVNQRQTMMSFPATDGLTLEVTPEMPSMGHGSPNNVNPVGSSEGRYVGKVNFTMTGDWRLHFKVTKQGTVIAEDVALDLLF